MEEHDEFCRLGEEEDEAIKAVLPSIELLAGLLLEMNSVSCVDYDTVSHQRKCAGQDSWCQLLSGRRLQIWNIYNFTVSL